MPEVSERTRGLLVLMLGIGGILLIVIVAVVLVVVVTQANRPSGGGISTGRTAPYQLELRPVPTTTKIQELFPAQFGTFVRKTITGNLSGSSAARFSATYQRNAETVTINGARDNNYAQAQADMNQAAVGVGDRTVTITSSMGYVLATTPTGVHLIYHHTNWFFDVTASSQKTLDDFMKVFPY